MVEGVLSSQPGYFSDSFFQNQVKERDTDIPREFWNFCCSLRKPSSIYVPIHIKSMYSTPGGF